jgi:hypothetical protein
MYRVIARLMTSGLVIETDLPARRATRIDPPEALGPRRRGGDRWSQPQFATVPSSPPRFLALVYVGVCGGRGKSRIRLTSLHSGWSVRLL